MEKVYSKKENCSGCSACFNACPTKAIHMEPDQEGFLYPVIDQALCVDCRKCVNICPIICEGNYKQQSEPEFLVAKHKSEDVLMSSTSGGAFTALSDAVLKEGGIIYGVDYDDEFRVLHKRTETIEGRNRMRVSKYVQSNMGNIFQQIEKDLLNKRTVLFTGTPCQTAGLRAYMRYSSLTENLYICDLICHSIPSPLVWEDYKKLLEKEHGGKLTDIQFRSKIIDWSRENSNKTFLYKTSTSEEVHNDERFYKLFFGAKTITRPSCSECRFTDIHRTSDITIADYWGIEKYAPEWMDTKGVSVILVNNEKGAKLLEKCSDALKYEKRPKEESLTEQQRLSEPVQFPEDRHKFWEDYREHGFGYIIEQLPK
ncbi:Coenzyme F420 hydrogenase/dehydrogenase, beta subunit C-terminal domain [Clostridium sp. HMP27]|uniref:Coenzyme F420 hydrogenase/dehydrogenase, beta subunit C-terminal domain n=1 Tax=Clostridium sp. HMP27 TaxID=1487921 RepID=UPI00052E4688|nr:Coenzyme F420 hydrogenase/dehydrogenase, beta subunit C-terminal domain [Clostridium sp. HMP27]KGK86737.1 4Fe-4S ferredoxin [Clostridium sp. HMP27]